MQLNTWRPAAATLADVGSRATIREVDCADASGVQRFVRSLSAESRYRRFLMQIPELPEDLLFRFTHPAWNREAVLVATTSDARIIALSQYARDDDGEGCELAIVVDDLWQHQGLGFRMLRALIGLARDAGIRYGHADVLADNHAMRGLARKLQCEIHTNARAPYLLRVTRQFGTATIPSVRNSRTCRTAREISALRTDCRSSLQC